MFPLLRTRERIREDRRRAARVACPGTADEVASLGPRPDATQIWAWTGTTALSGYGPAAADFLRPPPVPGRDTHTDM